MKRKLLYFILICMSVFCMFAFAACNSDVVLTTPENVSVDENTLLLSWDEVENARQYKLSINNEEVIVRNTYYSLESLATGEYQIKVKSVAGLQGYTDSAWSQAISFTREYESGLKFSLVNKDTAYEVTNIGTAGKDVVVPSTYRGKPIVGIASGAFRNCSELVTVTLANTVTYIGDYAFMGCTQLESVTFGGNEKSIGSAAFQSCRALKTMTIPSSVKTVDANAFSYCRGLETITLSEGLETLGEKAFAECTALKAIEIPASVTSIGENCFLDTTAMESATLGKNAKANLTVGVSAFGSSSIATLTLGSGILSIEESAFTNCKSLKTVDIPNGAISIGDYAFYLNTSLETVTIADSVTSIGSYAFAGDTSLTTVSIGNGVKTIGSYAFGADTSLENVSIGSGVTEMGEYAFYATAIWNNATDLVYADKWLVGNVNSSITSVTVREDTVGIGASALANSVGLLKLTLPESVKIAGAYAFNGCTALMSFTSLGLTDLGQYAFNGCDLLEKVKLNEGLTAIGASAFYGCTRLTEIEIPDSVEEIGYNAFYGAGLWENADYGVVYAGNWLIGMKVPDEGEDDEETVEVDEAIYTVKIKEGTVGIAMYAFTNTSVQYVSIPDTVTKLGTGIFSMCQALSYVSLPDNLTAIPDYTFYRCTGLYWCVLPSSLQKIGHAAFFLAGAYENSNQEISFGDNLTEIDDYAFYGANLLVTSFGNSLQTIGEKAFANNSGLINVVLPDSLTTIGAYAFYDCYNMESLQLGSGVKTIGAHAFEFCTLLTEMTVPSNVTDLGEYAFYGCEALEKVTIGNGLTEIKDFTFYGTALKAVYLPSSVRKIGEQAFASCLVLRSITLSENVEEIGDHAFYGAKRLTIYSEAKEAAAGWSDEWNSSYRPVVWGVTLSADKSYVVSITVENGIYNPKELTITAPNRNGYTFGGWSSEDKTYSANEAAGAEGTLTAVWNAGEDADVIEEEPSEETSGSTDSTGSASASEE